MTHPLKGRKQTPEAIAARVVGLRASGVYDKNHPRQQGAIERNIARTGEKRTDEQRAAHSVAMMGKNTGKLVGLKRPEEFRRKLSDYYLANPERHNHYVDGKSVERNGERNQARNRIDYRLWREAVFTRDDWTCVHCGQRGGLLHVDHIKTWRHFPELRYDVDNGRTLCVPCHEQTPTYKKSGKALRAAEGLDNASCI